MRHWFDRASRLVPGSKAGALVAAVACLALLSIGCPDMANTSATGGDSGGATDGSSGTLADVTGEIVAPRANQRLSSLEMFTSVIYNLSSVPSAAIVDGFYVPVSSGTADAVSIGDRVIIAPNLATGSGQAFNFDPQVSGPGNFRVGVLVTLDGAEIEIVGDGIITVEGPPNPRFIQPLDVLTTVVQGDEVFISFDAGDPENEVAWRLFRLAETDTLDRPADQLGTELSVGTGNVGSFTLPTEALTPGEYELGLSATDSGVSVAATVQNGGEAQIVTIPNESTTASDKRIIVVTEPGSANPPTLTFTSPAADVDLFGDQSFTIVFAVTAESGATGTVDVFLDLDTSSSNGFFQTIESGLSFSTTSVLFPSDLAEDTYNVCATVRQLSTAPVTICANGTITVVRTPTLTVTAPNTALPVRPGEAVGVAWSTNVPANAGLVDVFAQRLNADGTTRDEPEIPVLFPPGSPAITSTEFIQDRSGIYQITVRLTLNDRTISSADCVLGICAVAAPQPIRITTVPGILWLGSLADADPPFEGAVFEGIQPEDNAGAALSTAGDLNGDGLDEFIVGARFGKPFFVNPDGIGPGEAYLVFGSGGATKPIGVFNLNSLGTSTLNGVLLTGIRTVGDSNDTDGLSDITLIPDADGDGIGELAFGFPRTNSAGTTVGPLEAPGQFLNGGVVILSSDNSALRNQAIGTPRIDLAECGQNFSDLTVMDGDVTTVVADQLNFQQGDPNATPPTSDGCVAGTDGVLDTVTGPGFGFIPTLSPPASAALGFTEIAAGTTEADNVCVTQFAVAASCADDAGQAVFTGSNTGSGFYPSTATALEPKGARIIGTSSGDAFGTSITSSNSLGDSSPGDLIISAPNRSADPNLVDGITGTLGSSGVAFLVNNRNLWEPDNFFQSGETPPTPHQYVPGIASHCGDSRAPAVGALRLAGNTSDRIQTVLGIDDFNRDSRNDIAIGAPLSGNGQGRVYIAFRREEAVEGDFVLNKLELATDNPERLAGVLITTDSTDGLGATLATGVDFNGDGLSDLVVGSPDASGGTGEVIVIFGDANLQSPANGITIQDLLNSRNASGLPRAVRITGNPLDADGRFGWNIANGGDIDGDGLNDLLISAPNGTPRFDADPSDSSDQLSTPGVDIVPPFGVKDDVSGPFFLPDAVVDDFDDLSQAGLVYIVFGSNRLDQIRTCTGSRSACSTDDDCDTDNGESCAAQDMTISIDQLGSAQLEGFIIVGKHAGDRIGGGDAGDATQGGIANKSGRGRSKGLASAGDVDGDGRADILIGSVLADPRRDPNTGTGIQNAGEAYLIYGSVTNSMP